LKQAVPFNRYLAFFALAVAVCAADLGAKTWMFARFGSGGPRPPCWLWDGVFGFQTTLNEGALFGMGQGLWPLFAALSAGAVVGILIWLFPAGAGRDWLLTIALAFVTGGILGNLYDRLGLPGLIWPAGYGHPAGAPVHAVRDYILVMIGNWAWPTFNLADSALVCGAGLLVCHAFFPTSEDADGETVDGESKDVAIGG
jgi:signal peptidase II